MITIFDRKRSQGRPKNRWEDAVWKDANQLLKIRKLEAQGDGQRSLEEEDRDRPGLDIDCRAIL